MIRPSNTAPSPTARRQQSNKRPFPPFSPMALRDLERRVAEQLTQCKSFIRPQPVGDFVARFYLPLELAPPQDRMRCASLAKYTAYNRACYRWLEPQWLMQRGRCGYTFPLSGRPWLWCLRMSTTRPDEGSAWHKIPVDRLSPVTTRAKHYRLGLIVDDAPGLLDLRESWEPAPRGYGCCYFELRTGAKEAEAAG